MKTNHTKNLTKLSQEYGLYSTTKDEPLNPYDVRVEPCGESTKDKHNCDQYTESNMCEAHCRICGKKDERELSTKEN